MEREYEDRVFLSTGGGLGDVIQSYLADPVSPESCGDRYPTSNHANAMWFRRLRDFKEKHSDVHVKLILKSHNPASEELFVYHPYIDEIDNRGWLPPGVDNGDEFVHGEYDGARFIQFKYKYQEFAVHPPEVYLAQDEEIFMDAARACKPFVLIHPFSIGVRQAYQLGYYIAVIDLLVEQGYRVFVVGGSYTSHISGEQGVQRKDYFPYKRQGLVNLVDKASARVTTSLALECDGFIGTFSCMMLTTWYSETPNVVLLPQESDSWRLAEQDVNVRWGMDKPFTRAIRVENGLPEETVVNNLLEVMAGA
jgi:hypothetical protein